MKLQLAIVLLFALSKFAHADRGMPSQQSLATMGLSGLQVMSDSEALAVRGSGFDPGHVLVGLADYELHKLEFRQRVQEFQQRIDAHGFKGAASYQKHKAAFQAKVDKFRAKIH